MRLRVVVATFAVVLTLGPASLSAAAPMRVSGFARYWNGNPAAGARVKLHTLEGDSIRTADARGFSLSSLTRQQVASVAFHSSL